MPYGCLYRQPILMKRESVKLKKIVRRQDKMNAEKDYEETRTDVLPFERCEQSAGETGKPMNVRVKIPRKEKEGENANHVKAEAIAARLLKNAEGVRFGKIACVIKIHEGRVTAVVYSHTVNLKMKMKNNEEKAEE